MIVASCYFQRKNRRKIEPKETPSCSIPCLCVVLIWQLEILVTTLTIFQSHTCCVCIAQFFNWAVNSLFNFLFPCQGPITLITDNLPANFPGFPIDRRAQVALELYTTERSYVRSLETILQVWIDIELITVISKKSDVQCRQIKIFQLKLTHEQMMSLEGGKSGLSIVAGCQQKLLPTWLVSASYSAWYFFTDGIY